MTDLGLMTICLAAIYGAGILLFAAYLMSGSRLHPNGRSPIAVAAFLLLAAFGVVTALMAFVQAP